MREILFRGKRTDNDEWAYGNFVMDATEQVQREHIPLDPILADGFIRRYDLAQLKIVMHEVDRKTVGQYTGLTDKNGKRIFEGDILSERPSMNSVAFIGKVVFNEDAAAFQIVFDTGRAFVLGAYSKSYTVIGNIHDNPELMKGENHD